MQDVVGSCERATVVVVMELVELTVEVDEPNKFTTSSAQSMSEHAKLKSAQQSSNLVMGAREHAQSGQARVVSEGAGSPAIP